MCWMSLAEVKETGKGCQGGTSKCPCAVGGRAWCPLFLILSVTALFWESCSSLTLSYSSSLPTIPTPGRAGAVVLINHGSSTPSGSPWWPGHNSQPLHPSQEGTHRVICHHKEHKSLETDAKGSS